MEKNFNRRGSCCALGAFLVFSVAGVSSARVDESISGWTRIADLPVAVEGAKGDVRPQSYAAFKLDRAVLAQELSMAPLEDTPEAAMAIEIELPMPDGSFAKYVVVESPVMHPDLQAQYPEIRSYLAQGIDDPASVARIDLSPRGFRGMIRSEGGTIFINPGFSVPTDYYMSFNVQDTVMHHMACATPPGPAMDPFPPAAPERDARGIESRVGPTRRTYDLAVSTTGEFSLQYGGGTLMGTLAAINSHVNRINLVYENEVAVRFQLVANNANIIFLNESSDPYQGTDGDLLGQNQAVVDAGIGFGNYDIGHLFNAGFGSGIAQLGVVCGGAKARGVSSIGGQLDSPDSVGLVVHEMGHQFNAPHSFNGINGACGGNWDGSGSYEPGGGSTPMSYVNICAGDSYQATYDLYFHSGTFDRITNFLNSATCSTNTATGNIAPVVDAGPNFTIPTGTPYILTGSGTDANGDAVTFNWEQRDLGPQASLGAADNGQSPLVRSIPPGSSPVRFVPNLPSVLGNIPLLTERAPAVARTMDWRLSGRDNRPGNGGVNTDDMVINVVGAAGPFQVTSPNTNGQFSQSLNVTWNVANTNLAPINTANVRIELSEDGGNTWPHILAASTPNDGSQTVTLPAISTTQGRIRIFATNSIYYDVSNTNFTVTPQPAPAPFMLTMPSNQATNVSLTPMLAWTASPNADDYVVELDTDVGFSLPVTYSNTVVGLSDTVPPGVLAPNTLYYFRVIARNAFATLPGSPNPSQFSTVPPTPFCQGDGDGDGDVDFGDITASLANFGQTYTPGSRGPGDANNNGFVDFVDFATILASWNANCP